MNDVLSLKYIPQELKFEALWCAWKFVPSVDKDGVIDNSNLIKKPFNVLTGYGAKSNDPSTFVSYPVLLQHIQHYLSYDENGKQMGGVGLGIFKGFSAVDIDHCVSEDGTISEMARDIINYCKSYTEYSPSKTGIRIIFKTDIKIDKNLYYINNHKNGLEIYISDNTNKFVTITGNRISDEYSDVNKIDITYILEKYMKRESSFDIDKVLEKDDKLRELWNSVASGSHGNESETDMALCCKLAFYFRGDESKIDRYFRMSPYYASKDSAHKQKWERDDYRYSTIKGAVDYIMPSLFSYPQQSQTNSVSVKRSFELNDTGNARRFVDKFGNDLHYNVDNCMWMIYNGRFWQHDVKEKIRDYVEILAEEMLFESNKENDLNTRARLLKNVDHIYNSAGKDSLLKEARHIGVIPALNDDFDRNPYYLCTNNGTVDLQTSSIKENSKEDMISMSVSGEIDLDHEPTLFLKFLNEVFQNNEKLIRYIQKCLAYSASGTTREQCMWILYGDGNNGKSLLLEVIRETLGSYAISTRPQLLTEQRNGNSNLEEIARLKGKRFIVVEETKAGDKLDESLIKSLTSGIGNQVARFLYGNSFEFPVIGKMWMATNYKPVIRGTDKGIWRRIKVIPVTVDFEGREDKDLKYKLLQEKPQILGWLVKGFQLYQQEGLVEPPEVNQSIKEYREEMDIVANWINECCECKPDYFEQANVLFENFNAYIKKGEENKMSQTLFGRNLTKKFTKKCFNGRNVYIGIRLRKDRVNLEREVKFDQIKVNENI